MNETKILLAYVTEDVDTLYVVKFKPLENSHMTAHHMALAACGVPGLRKAGEAIT